MPHTFRVIKRVEFADTDMAGIMHFANFFRFMEETEHAFFRFLGFSIHSTFDGVKVGWPRVHASCDFYKPLYCEDEVEIELRVCEKKEKSLTYEFIFRRLVDDEVGEEVARGRSTVVCIRFGAGGKIQGAIPIPPAIADKIQVATADAESD